MYLMSSFGQTIQLLRKFTGLSHSERNPDAGLALFSLLINELVYEIYKKKNLKISHCDKWL